MKLHLHFSFPIFLWRIYSIKNFPFLQDDLLKILGEKHRLYDFLSSLSMKCSYLLFNKEHVKEILSDVNTHNSAGNMHFTRSCMDLLVVRICQLYILLMMSFLSTM
jgi:hypothetical protein